MDMTQGHGEPLSASDAAFLDMESRSLHMHVGGLFVFDPPETGEFEFGWFVRLVRSRIHRVPRYRQRLAHPPLRLTTPVWVDDPEFDLSYHLRHAALPRPGTVTQLTEFAARILSRQLDRDRPLWELYVIEGLEDGGFALLGKSHHAMVDGRSGMDIATVVLDLCPEDSEDLPAPQPWTPAPLPSGVQLVRDAARDAIASPAAAVDTARQSLRAPLELGRRAVAVGQGVVSTARSTLTHRAPRSMLNQTPGAYRRFAIGRLPLEDVKHVKDTFHTAVNDVVLAVVADATGRYLRSRGARTDGVWLRVMVPVSTRTEDADHTVGGEVVSVFVDLPMFELDAVERLRICHEAMRDVKSSHQAVGASFLVGLTQFTPPTLHAMASRLAARGRLFNFLVTNVPGPQVPVYCLGARLRGAYPFSPLAASHCYSVGLTSTEGALSFAITADYDALPDVEQVPEHLVAALAELTANAEAADQRREESTPRTHRGGAADAKP
jgi:diacylglycerol O-acyltransferase / wax synthase